MLLIDTSVWISFFNDSSSPSARFVEEVLTDNEPVCINGIIEMEILQGIKDERAYRATKEYLVDFQYFPEIKKEYLALAVEIFRACRKKGVTIRRSLDCLIAANCLIDGLAVAHRDRDFELIGRVFPELREKTIP